MPFMKKVSIPRSGLVAEYLFNNNVLDTSGNGYNGVNNNVTFGLDRKSNSNAAGVFNGTTAFVDIDAALSGLSTTTKGTWSAWVKPIDATPSVIGLFISFGDTILSNLLQVRINTDGRLFSAVTDSPGNDWTLSTDSVVFSDNIWTHIAIVQDGVSPIVYANGVSVAKTFGDTRDVTSWFSKVPEIDNGRIGDVNFNSGGEQFHFSGSIDDIRVYNRALIQTEITALANE